MVIQLAIGLLSGLLFIGIGYIVRSQGVSTLLAAFWITWEPVNNKRLGNNIGILFIILGVLAILTAIFTIWFGAVVGKISAILALIDAIMIFIVIGDRKSTRLNSSHVAISYAVFCLKKKNQDSTII